MQGRVYTPSGERHRHQGREFRERETAPRAVRSRVQSPGRIGALWRQRADATSRNPPDRVESQSTDCVELFRGARRPSRKKAGATIIKETEDIASYQAPLAELEPLLASSVGFRKADGPDNGVPEWLANTLSSIAKHVQESGNIDREAVVQSLLGLLVAAPPLTPTRCTAEWNTGPSPHRHERRYDPWEQARGWRRLVTKHEQSDAHNKDDVGRDAATRRCQGSPSRRVVRLMTPTINVTSAASIPEAKDLNTTGRMAGLDYLYSEAGVDIIGV